MERLQVRWSSVTVSASLAVCCWCDKFCSVKGLLRLKSWSSTGARACLDSNVDACIKFLRFFCVLVCWLSHHRIASVYIVTSIICNSRAVPG